MAKDKKIFTEDLAAALRTPFESGPGGCQKVFCTAAHYGI